MSRLDDELDYILTVGEGVVRAKCLGYLTGDDGLLDHCDRARKSNLEQDNLQGAQV